MKRCPRCKLEKLKEVLHRNALSRRDNLTVICSSCGRREALEDNGLLKPTWIQQYVTSGGLAYLPYWDTSSPTWLKQLERQKAAKS